VVKIEFLLQKVEISVRELCGDGEIRTLDPNTERAAPPLKGAPAFFKDTYYILHCATKIKSAFSKDE
jgi:hypothetical protein